MDQISSNKVKFYVLMYFYCIIYIFSIAAMEVICSKTYFSLLHEIFKAEVPKITQKLDWTKCFSTGHKISNLTDMH